MPTLSSAGRRFYGLNLALFAALLGWCLASYWLQPRRVPVREIPEQYAPPAPTGGPSDDLTHDGSDAEDAVEAATHEARQPLQQRAQAAFRRGNVAAALDAISAAVQQHPRDPALRSDLGTYLMRAGRPEEAIASFREALRLDSDFALAYFNLGTAYLKQGRAAEAISPLERALTLTPYYAEARYNLAQSRARLGDDEGALEGYRSVVETDHGATAVKAYYNLGLLLARRGHYGEAIAAFTSALQKQPDYLKARFSKARALTRLERSDEALGEYRKLLQIEPRHVGALINLGVLLMRERDWEEATLVLTQASEADPRNPRAPYNLGLCYGKLKRRPEAVRSFEKAVGLDPDFSEAHYNLGLARKRTGDVAGARASFERAVSLSPDRPEYHYNFALALSRNGEGELAIEQYSTALRLKPNYFRARYNLALQRYRGGDYEAARVGFEQARRLRPSSYEATYNLGLAWLKLGAPEAAAQAFAGALTLEETEEARYNLGLARARSGQLERAVKEFRAALRIDPKHRRSLRKLAEVYLTLERPHASLESLGHLQQIDPDDPTAYETGMRLAEGGQPRDALPFFELARQAEGIRAGEARQAEQALRQRLGLPPPGENPLPVAPGSATPPGDRADMEKAAQVPSPATDR